MPKVRLLFRNYAFEKRKKKRSPNRLLIVTVACYSLYPELNTRSDETQLTTAILLPMKTRTGTGAILTSGGPTSLNNERRSIAVIVFRKGNAKLKKDLTVDPT